MRDARRQVPRRPLALEIYCWLTYRLSYLRRPCRIPWEALQLQFGADYCRLRDFRRRFADQLAAGLRVYPSARVTDTDAGVLLYPSSPHVTPRAAASSQSRRSPKAEL